MTVHVGQFDDEENKVYLFGLNNVSIDEIGLWEDLLESTFENVESVLIADDFDFVDKTLFYAELSAEEWSDIAHHNSGENE